MLFFCCHTINVYGWSSCINLSKRVVTQWARKAVLEPLLGSTLIELISLHYLSFV